MMVAAIPEQHCGQFLAFWASFLSGRDAPDRGGQLVGNTARCRVCGEWFAYVWLGSQQFIFEMAPSRQAVERAAAAA